MGYLVCHIAERTGQDPGLQVGCGAQKEVVCGGDRCAFAPYPRKRTITVFPFSSRRVSSWSFSAFTMEESEAWP